MQIEAGKFYRTRDGRRVGPMGYYEDEFLQCEIDGLKRLFKISGGEHRYGMRDLDLIAEWVDELPHGHARLPSGAVVDLTAITTPFGLLDEVYGPGAQEALRAHGGPWEGWCEGAKWEKIHDPYWSVTSTYRVKPQPPAPVVKTVTIEPWEVVTDVLSGYRITFDLIDGVPDCASTRMVAL